MSASDATAAKKLAKASAKKEARYVESLRTQIVKKGFNVKSLAEALLLPPPSPKVKKVPKETIAKAWIAHAYETYAAEYPVYLATLPQDLQDAEKEKESKSGKMVKQDGLKANRNKTNFSKKMGTDHAADYAAFKITWDAAHPTTPVEEESATESGSGSAARAACSMMAARSRPGCIRSWQTKSRRRSRRRSVQRRSHADASLRRARSSIRWCWPMSSASS